MNKKIVWGLIIVLLVGGILFAAFRPRAEYTLEPGPRPYRGNSQAEILVEVFSDFQCPACRSVEPYLKTIEEQYGYQIKIAFRHFPLTSIHPLALRAGIAAECANDQGKFWEYHDALYERQAQINTSFFGELARELQLDMNNFDACMDRRAHLNTVRSDMREGTERGVNATPTIFVNGQQVPVTQLGQLLEVLTKR